jgi:oxygen-independent coproporphyrinogen-3 oxidase
MCDFELDFTSIENEFDIDFETYFSPGLDNLDEMIADNLLSIENKILKITKMGRFLIRNIAINFDGYIERKEDHARYSRTV